MTKVRFQFLVGLILLIVLLSFSAIFFRYTAQIAAEMPRESVEMLQQATHQTERKGKKHTASVAKRFTYFIQNIQKNMSKSTDKKEKEKPSPLEDPKQSQRVTDPLKQ